MEAIRQLLEDNLYILSTERSRRLPCFFLENAARVAGARA